MATARPAPRPRRNARASSQKQTAAAAITPMSGLTTPDMNPNSGWSATASAPAVQVHGWRGSSSRRNKKVARTAMPASSAETSRIAAIRSRIEPPGVSLYATAPSA